MSTYTEVFDKLIERKVVRFEIPQDQWNPHSFRTLFNRYKKKLMDFPSMAALVRERTLYFEAKDKEDEDLYIITASLSQDSERGSAVEFKILDD